MAISIQRHTLPIGGLECIVPPPPKLPKPLYKWTLNDCDNILFGEFIVQKEHKILVRGSNVVEIPKNSGVFFLVTDHGKLEIGFAYPLAVHLTRSREIISPTPIRGLHTKKKSQLGPDFPFQYIPVCRYTIARYVIMSNGDEITINCSQPTHRREETIKSSLAISFIKTKDQKWKSYISELMENGFEYDLSTFRTPYVRPVVLYSTKKYCGVGR